MTQNVICLPCAAKGGRRDGCKLCAAIAPRPLFLKVADIINKAAIEHERQRQADAEIFNRDISGKKKNGAGNTSRRDKNKALEAK